MRDTITLSVKELILSPALQEVAVRYFLDAEFRSALENIPAETLIKANIFLDPQEFSLLLSGLKYFESFCVMVKNQQCWHGDS